MNLVIPDKRPRIRQKVQALDQRSFTVVPIRAASDRSLTPMELRALLVYCSYTNKGGVAWVSAKTIGETLGVSISRAARLLKALTAKGYLKTLHKGFSGVVAHTRQVMYKDISADEAAAIAGELAPYQLEKQTKEQQAMIDEQAKKAKAAAKRQERKAKQTAKLIEKSNSKVASDSVQLSIGEGKDSGLVDFDIHTHHTFAHIDADILALAIASLGDAPHTIDNIEAAIDRLMR